VHWGIGEWGYRALLADRALSAGDRDASVKPEQACPDPSETLVFVVFGQSNAANHGSGRLRAPIDVFDFYDGRCFSGDDPQFGATGTGGSPWPAFADALREKDETRPILMVNIAVGNSRADEWEPGTEHSQRLQSEVRTLSEKGYTVTAFLYFQGEADRETSTASYQLSLSNIATMVGDIVPGAAFILSDSSICGLGTRPVEELSRARAATAASHEHVYIGPNTDALGQEFRFDGCHFTEAGLKALGSAWAQSVREIIPR